MQEGGVAYADIVVLALIAGFILLRLRSVLGKNSEHLSHLPEERPTEKPESQDDNVIEGQFQVVEEEPEEDFTEMEESGEEGNRIAARLRDVKKMDPTFRLKSFIEGAKVAFDMVLEAFAAGDRKTLRSLLSDEVYESFLQAIRARKEEENTTETTLIAIHDAEVTGVDLLGSQVQITVRFESEQVTVTRNPDGEVVDGDPTKAERVEDVWVFERDVRSNDPNWKLVSTDG